MCKIFCGSKDCEECFERSFASHPKARWWSDKNELKPWQISKGSNKKIYFDCDKCNHYFSSTLCNILGGNWCPFCSHRKLCDNDDCGECFNRSFASHEKSKYWSNKNKLIPRQVFLNSNNKFDFKCDKCIHYFTALLSSISSDKKPTWCPYCFRKKLCDNNDCDDCFNKSFASHEKSKYWSSRNDVFPRFIFKSAKNKYYFNCNNCNHEFNSSIYHVTSTKLPRWCPYCTNQQLCDNIDCDICFNKSFASHEKSKFLTDKNINPRYIFKNSNKKYEFTCEDCNGIFNSVLSGVTRQYITSSWCPYCVNKTEKKLFDYLSKEYLDINRQYKPEWCISNVSKRFLPFDFFIPSLNIIIEIDGKQHFKQVLNWDNPKHTQSKDLYKMKKAYDNGISVIRIPCNFIWEDCYFKTYKNKLKENLYLRDQPEIIYLCDDDRYDHFKDFNFDEDNLLEIIPK